MIEMVIGDKEIKKKTILLGFIRLLTIKANGGKIRGGGKFQRK